MSGGAYYKSLRAHFLVDAALCPYLLEGEFSDEELDEMKLFIIRCEQEKLGSTLDCRISQHFDEKIENWQGSQKGDERQNCGLIITHKF